MSRAYTGEQLLEQGYVKLNEEEAALDETYCKLFEDGSAQLVQGDDIVTINPSMFHQIYGMMIKSAAIAKTVGLVEGYSEEPLQRPNAKAKAEKPSTNMEDALAKLRNNSRFKIK